MKTRLLSLFCILIFGWGSPSTVSAQDLQAMEKSLLAITNELNQKTKEYSWQLATAYSYYCEDNSKYINWNDIPYLKEIVEFEHPLALEEYRLAYEACKDKMEEYLDKHKEYRNLKKKQLEAFSQTEKDENKAAFNAFFMKLRKAEPDTYKALWYAHHKASCRYRAEGLRYVVAHFKEKNQLLSTSFIKYDDRNYLLEKGTDLSQLQKELNTLEDLQRELVRNIAKAKYGMSETGQPSPFFQTPDR